MRNKKLLAAASLLSFGAAVVGCSGGASKGIPDGGRPGTGDAGVQGVEMVIADGFWISSDAGAGEQGLVLYHSGASRTWDPVGIIFRQAGLQTAPIDCLRYVTNGGPVGLVDGGAPPIGRSFSDGPSSQFVWDVNQDENVAPYIERNIQRSFRDYNHIVIAFTMSGSVIADTDAGMISAEVGIRYLDADSGLEVTSEASTMVLTKNLACPF